MFYDIEIRDHKDNTHICHEKWIENPLRKSMEFLFYFKEYKSFSCSTKTSCSRISHKTTRSKISIIYFDVNLLKYPWWYPMSIIIYLITTIIIEYKICISTRSSPNIIKSICNLSSPWCHFHMYSSIWKKWVIWRITIWGVSYWKATFTTCKWIKTIIYLI